MIMIGATNGKFIYTHSTEDFTRGVKGAIY